MKIRIVLFKQRKLLFKQHKQTPTKYQTDPKFLYLLKFKYKHDKNCEIYFVYRFIVLSLYFFLLTKNGGLYDCIMPPGFE